MSALRMFIPLIKVDAARRRVYGVATAEQEDRAGEICDYASTKPFYEKWSAEIAKSTRGKSLGNLRAMHGNVAAGKVIEITFNDAAKQIEICAKVVDDAEWAKVLEGVYTGFSQGGSYERRWTDAEGCTRYTASPTEISLVDLPCLSRATAVRQGIRHCCTAREYHPGIGLAAERLCARRDGRARQFWRSWGIAGSCRARFSCSADDGEPRNCGTGTGQPFATPDGNVHGASKSHISKIVGSAEDRFPEQRNRPRQNPAHARYFSRTRSRLRHAEICAKRYRKALRCACRNACGGPVAREGH
jgi:hypothetical protein